MNQVVPWGKAASKVSSRVHTAEVRLCHTHEEKQTFLFSELKHAHTRRPESNGASLTTVYQHGETSSCSKCELEKQKAKRVWENDQEMWSSVGTRGEIQIL